MNCRHCSSPLTQQFVDLGESPPSNAFVVVANDHERERTFPLRVLVCTDCWLAQTEDFVRHDEMFSSSYAYFSGTSATWRQHVSIFADQVSEELGLDSGSAVLEIACNDGVLLEAFQKLGIPSVGVEPTANTADLARSRGCEVIQEFFSERFAEDLRNRGMQFDLVVGNNVYAHVPDINDFTSGISRVLKDEGVVSLEFPHLLNLIKENQFDTIYHEHFSYLSLSVVCKIFRQSGLRVWRVEQISTHGGSLRVYGALATSERPEDELVQKVLAEEWEFGLSDVRAYLPFQENANMAAQEFLSFLLWEKALGRVVVGVGAAAKGNTLLNFAKVSKHLMAAIFESAPSKHGTLAPGTQIPVLPMNQILEYSPDTVVILPWNLREELVSELRRIGLDKVRIVTAIPYLEVTE